MADIHVAKILEGVNGPLLEALAKRANYQDVDAIELFRTGAPIVGRLDRCAPRSALCARELFVYCALQERHRKAHRV